MLFKHLFIFTFLAIACGDEYVVQLKEGETFADFYANDIKYAPDLRVRDHIAKTFSIGKFQGFIGNFTKLALERLKKCPYVSEVSPDVQVHALDVVVQEHLPRHLARISQRKKLKKRFKFAYDDDASGKDINAYVIDSGIEIGHPDFEGRAVVGQDFTGEGLGDNNGHGTHVAGIIGSTNYGVSKNVHLIDVKALAADGSGSLSTIIAALEFCVNHHKKSHKPGVANLSLGAPTNVVLNQALDAAVENGLLVVVAAGNSNMNACRSSPGSAAGAVTVGSIDDRLDTLAPFSNWGPCVDILAPGVNIESVDKDNYSQAKILSGTSMSSPIVTGIVANMLSNGIEPSDIEPTLLSQATPNKVSSFSLFLKSKTPNLIAYLDLNVSEDDDDDED